MNETTGMENPTPSAPASYAFVLKLNDQPGGMEVIGATFAHRGVSLGCTLGNDGTLDPEGRATVIVTFSATPAKKEIIRRALGRLSRVRSLVEHAMDSPTLRKIAVFRAADQNGDSFATANGRLEKIARDEATGELTYILTESPEVVDAFLFHLREAGRLRNVITTVIGL